MDFLQSSPLPQRRPLSANEIAAIALATVTACPAPRNMSGGIERMRRVNGTKNAFGMKRKNLGEEIS